MKEDRKFLRLCCICRQYKRKDELIKITRDYKTGEAVINTDNSVIGRSIYICRNYECIEKFLKNKKSIRMLKAKTSENINDMLRTVLKN